MLNFVQIGGLAVVVSGLACSQGVRYEKAESSYQKSSNNSADFAAIDGQDSQNADSLVSDLEDLEGQEEKTAEDAGKEKNTMLTKADILSLANVTINGNGGLEEDSADFAKRYVDPNGKPLNAEANRLTLMVGQTLSVCNDAEADGNLRVHTNGQPFPHGANIQPGDCTEYTLSGTFQATPNNFYDHNLGQGAYSIFIEVISEDEAADIINAS
jgi:hypothetical protein